MATPVIFIPGLWLHAQSWQPWVELYGAAGYDPAAPGWPGSADTVDEARANPDSGADYGINEITDHYARIIDSLRAKPIVIGHSFGGLIAQKLLGQGSAAAAVAIDPAAPGWPGSADTVDEARANPDSGDYGINEITDHYARIIGSLRAKPIVIGHSFGGLIAQKLLGQGSAAAAVAIDPAQIKGVLALPVSTLRVGSPVLSKPANRHRCVTLTEAQFRYGFGNAVSAAESADLYRRWAVPSPGKPLFEAAFANFSPNSPAKVNTANAARGPLLVTAGEHDHTVPPVISRATVKQYRRSAAVTDFTQFPGRGHSLTIDHGWHEVAESVLAWLTKHDL